MKADMKTLETLARGLADNCSTTSATSTQQKLTESRSDNAGADLGDD